MQANQEYYNKSSTCNPFVSVYSFLHCRTKGVQLSDHHGMLRKKGYFPYFIMKKQLHRSPSQYICNPCCLIPAT